MVLVDTSAWLRAFYGKQPYRRGVDRLLEREDVLGHELVYGELLSGNTGGRTAQLESYVKFDFARSVPHSEVVAMVNARHLQGRGIGWIDAQLLASALVERAMLYTADAALDHLADELGVAFRP